MAQRNVVELVHINAPALLALMMMLNEREVVFAYAKRWAEGERWPPIDVSAAGFCMDGAHRLAAAFYLNHALIDVKGV